MAEKTDKENRLIRSEPFGYEWPGGYFIGDEELEYVTRVVRARSPFRHYGLDPQRMCELFEEEFARYCGSAHALGVSSGTAALKVALAALGVGPGQEVIIPGYMWISTVAAVVQSGAIPVLCEVDETFALDPEDLPRRITPRTTTIIHVHMSGTTGHIEEVRAIAKRQKLWLVEDCAQAAGGSYKGKKLGTFGDMGTFSFQYNKAMTTGEGGMVVTDDELLFKRSQAAQDAVHKTRRAIRAIGFSQLDRFIDNYFDRGFPIHCKFPQSNPQDIPIYNRHLVQGPFRGMFGDKPVQGFEHRRDA